MKKLSFLTAAFIMMSLVSCGKKKETEKNDK
jgi:predicted small lipoprotein YifL